MQNAQRSTEQKTEPAFASELDEPIWALVSFERCEATELTFNEVVQKLAELESQKIAGLCIVTSEAAARIVDSPA